MGKSVGYQSTQPGTALHWLGRGKRPADGKAQEHKGATPRFQFFVSVLCGDIGCSATGFVCCEAPLG